MLPCLQSLTGRDGNAVKGTGALSKGRRRSAANGGDAFLDVTPHIMFTMGIGVANRPLMPASTMGRIPRSPARGS
jgi:hypothetical protein